MTTIPNRRPAGTPAGGQFAPSTNPEAEMALDGPIPRNRPPMMGLLRHINPDGSEGGWVSPDASVGPNAVIGADAMVLDSAMVLDEAMVLDHAVVSGMSVISGKAVVFDAASVHDSLVADRASVSGRATVEQFARIEGDAAVMGWARISGASVSGLAQVGGSARLPWGARVTDGGQVFSSDDTRFFTDIGPDETPVTVFRLHNGRARIAEKSWEGSVAELEARMTAVASLPTPADELDGAFAGIPDEYDRRLAQEERDRWADQYALVVDSARAREAAWQADLARR